MSNGDEQFFRVWPSATERAVNYYAPSAENAFECARADGYVMDSVVIVDGLTDERYILKNGMLTKDGKQCCACGMG